MSQVADVAASATALTPVEKLQLVGLLLDQLRPCLTSDSVAAVSGDAWQVLGELSGTVDGPPDWAAEHDHHLYDTPKRAGGDHQ